MTPQEARIKLLERRQALEEEARLDDEGRKPVALDQESVGRLSRMDAMQVQAMAQALERRRQSEKARIDAALARIDDDEFGWCIDCGEQIAPKRLAHDPSVAKCVKCAQ